MGLSCSGDERALFVRPTRSDKMRTSSNLCGVHRGGVCVQDVDLGLLATETENFSGAEIEGLVRSAASYAFQRNVNVSDITKPADIDNIKVSTKAPRVRRW